MKAPIHNVCRAASFEMRESADDGFTLEGYAAVFDSPTRIDSWEGEFDETIARGAFVDSLDRFMPVMQFDHGRDPATGSVPIGSIEEIREDDHGLFVRARLNDNEKVKPIRQAIASGAIDGMSFRFKVSKESWDKSAEIPSRTIRGVELFELGPVVFPAYASTSVGVRSMLADLDEDERRALVRDLADEIAPVLSEDDQQVTRDSEPEADQQVAEVTPSSTLAARRQMARQIEAHAIGARKKST